MLVAEGALRAQRGSFGDLFLGILAVLATELLNSRIVNYKLGLWDIAHFLLLGLRGSYLLKGPT